MLFGLEDVICIKRSYKNNPARLIPDIEFYKELVRFRYFNAEVSMNCFWNFNERHFMHSCLRFVHNPIVSELANIMNNYSLIFTK